MQEGLVRALHPIATIVLSGIGFDDFCVVVIALECKPSDLNESLSARLLFYFIGIPKKRRLLRGANAWPRATVCFGCCLRLGFGGASLFLYHADLYVSLLLLGPALGIPGNPPGFC
jgi:hypothetical protein